MTVGRNFRTFIHENKANRINYLTKLIRSPFHSVRKLLAMQKFVFITKKQQPREALRMPREAFAFPFVLLLLLLLLGVAFSFSFSLLGGCQGEFWPLCASYQAY